MGEGPLAKTWARLDELEEQRRAVWIVHPEWNPWIWTDRQILLGQIDFFRRRALDNLRGVVWC